MKDPEMLTCRIPRQLLYRLQDCADERELSVSELLRIMIKRSVYRYSAESAKQRKQQDELNPTTV